MERQAPKMTIRIRVATIEDAGPLAHISEKTFRASYAKFNAPEDMNAYCAETFGKAQQTSEILHPAKTTLLLENRGVLSGFAQICWHKAPNCALQASSPSEVRRFYLEQNLHGTGAAQTLMNSVFKEAQKTETDVLWLGVWMQNFKALAFYRKYGFIEVGEHTFQLGADRQTDLILSTHLKSRAPDSP